MRPVWQDHIEEVKALIRSIVTLADRPDLVEAMWAVPSSWPPFMLQDPVAHLFYSGLPQVFPEHQLVALDDDGAVVARVNSVPFA